MFTEKDYERASRLAEQQVAYALATHREQAKAPRNTTGLCSDCDGNIRERLEAMPTAMRCTECRQIHDKLERR
ncbi:MAG: hypothetical protein R3175_07430 [Marinobacter sp.]|uniref:hypothetical protein n=1 Tax=Marinobacter sp. TaxID=50741 RepID=UPI00299F2520|nr:hypothetical protein [Marinobacter sp.]MDX1755871.1 hypothetical protein [Marinobacter sp.]